jgi:hypothetical protein
LLSGAIVISFSFGNCPARRAIPSGYYQHRCLRNTLSVVGERVRRFIEGYYAYMRGGTEDGDLVYVESDHELRLYFRRHPHVIYVPSDGMWVATMPDWAKQKKKIIMQRMRSQVAKHWSFEETESRDRLLAQK